MAALTAALFLLSAVLNFGARIPLGFAELSFSAPLASTGEIEVIIGLALIVSAGFSRLYGYGGAYLLALVGILSGLLSPDVQGLARSLHEAMLPVALVGCAFLLLEARDAYRSGARQPSGQLNRGLVTALQFFVGGLVTLGGVGYAATATYPVGTSLGLIHLVVGLAGLFGGFAFYRRKTWSRGFLIAINIVTVAYSAFSEGAAQVYSLLPPGISDSLIGTIIAIAVSVVIVYQLLSRPDQHG
ncbi:MAG: hypothetical protein OK456_11600 [Thaumarchaeota archaeon]|nr:hypothetical protein [Nitrososphaerota archaeon]